ncbi:hypothetical protein ERJ75_000315000 [Trypanosoma vivax]|nr:hypothetical protein ERJ75_000315000 [Trypanosoma vivax]
MSLGWIVTRPLWMHARFVSASSDTMYDSVASCAARIALLWKRTPPLCSGHLAHEALEGRLLQQQVRGALELADLAERHRPGPPAALRVLHARAGVRCLGRLLALLRRHRFFVRAVSLVRDMVLCLA